MTTRINKRKAVSESSESISGSNASKESDKTIPFLRRLVDMLQENDEVISFYPGALEDGQKLLGKIVVHDRARVEAEILPRYFSHSSFASLRRQLNYFSFTRVGKGRQRGATYCNEGVIELDDILLLKRRTVGSASNVAEGSQSAVVPAVVTNSEHEKDENAQSLASDASSWQSNIRNALVPFVHLNPEASRERSTFFPKTAPRTKKSRLNRAPSIISPVNTPPVQSDEEGEPVNQTSSRIILDLTAPSPLSRPLSDYRTLRNELGESLVDDDDILAGCKALLSFSSSCSRRQISLA